MIDASTQCETRESSEASTQYECPNTFKFEASKIQWVFARHIEEYVRIIDVTEKVNRFIKRQYQRKIWLKKYQDSLEKEEALQQIKFEEVEEAETVSWTPIDLSLFEDFSQGMDFGEEPIDTHVIMTEVSEGGIEEQNPFSTNLLEDVSEPMEVVAGVEPVKTPDLEAWTDD